MHMHTITHIGVIDTNNKSHIEFAVLALQHKAHMESVLAYELWSSDELDLAVITQQRSDILINQIMYLKSFTHQRTQNA